MQDLKDVTNNVHYENYRCLKLAGVVNSPDPKHFQAPSRYDGCGVAGGMLNDMTLSGYAEIPWPSLRWRRESTR